MRPFAMRAELMAFAGAIAFAPALLLLAPAPNAVAQSQTPPAVAPASPTGKPAVEPLPQVVTAEVAGFRSARFGMTPEQVQDAVKRDFDIEPKAIGKLRNDLQKTDILAIQVDNLVPGSGPSKVFYLFGYASKKLIHVNVVWGKQAEQAIPPATLVNTGRILQQYFLGQGFAKEGMAVNQSVPGNQILLFQGNDEKKRTVQLILEMTPVAVEKPADPKAPAAKPPAAQPKPATPAAKPADPKAAPAQLVATSLRLSYIENVTTPDIYRVPKGKF